MQKNSRRLICIAVWASFASSAPAKGAEAKWDDCPRIKLDAAVGVDRLCQHTVEGANSVPLFQAMARLWLGQDLPAANQMLREACRNLLGGATVMTPQLADANAKWQMRLWVRTYFLFNSRSAIFPGRLDTETERLIEELLWNYAYSKSTVDRAALHYVWFIQGSENHDLMDLSNAFLALQAIQDLPQFRSRPLRDGKTAAEHVQAWTRYYQAYANERVARGLLVECASSIYGKYSVPELVNLADFADDAVVRRKMTMLLDVLWADWAVEQLDGVRGGGKSRVYQGKYAQSGGHDSYRQMAEVLLGRGPWTHGKHAHTNSGFVYCLATTNYRLPKIVQRLTNPGLRGSYASVSRRPAKMIGVHKLPEHLPHPCWYMFDPQDTRAVRYTYCEPEYVMGSWWVDPRLGESSIVRSGAYESADPPYAAIHAQNRWQGIIFRTGSGARIYPQCLTTKKRDDVYSVSNHQQIAVQHENVMIVQANLARKDIKAMRVYVAGKIRETLTQRDGWWMARVGNACVAFKGVDTETGATSAGIWEDNNYFRLADRQTPVLMVAGTTARFSNLDRFAVYVGDLQHAVDRNVLTVRFSDFDKQAVALAVDLQQRLLPRVNGQPIDLNPTKVFTSPYMQSDFGSGQVTIRSQNQAYTWNMNDNSIRASR